MSALERVCPRCKWDGCKAPECWPLCSSCLARAGAPVETVRAAVVREAASSCPEPGSFDVPDARGHVRTYSKSCDNCGATNAAAFAEPCPRAVAPPERQVREVAPGVFQATCSYSIFGSTPPSRPEAPSVEEAYGDVVNAIGPTRDGVVLVGALIAAVRAEQSSVRLTEERDEAKRRLRFIGGIVGNEDEATMDMAVHRHQHERVAALAALASLRAEHERLRSAAEVAEAELHAHALLAADPRHGRRAEVCADALRAALGKGGGRD